MSRSTAWITFLLDPLSAQRAEGLSIDFLSGPEVSGFEVEHPNPPPRVKQISAAELKAMMDRAVPFELVDVRTEEERAIAKIEGSRLLNEEVTPTCLLWIGTRQSSSTVIMEFAARPPPSIFYAGAGFRNLYNVRGGIDDWSEIVDPSVPRY